MTADGTSSNDRPAGARGSPLRLAGWGLACGALWHGVIVALLGWREARQDICAAFYAATVVAAPLAGCVLPRVPGSLALLLLAGTLGGATSLFVEVKARSPGFECLAVAVLIAAMLVSLRIVLDLFAGRWSVRARRIAALLAGPGALFAMMVLIETAQHRNVIVNHGDWMFVLSASALALAVVPPRAWEAVR